MGQLAGEDDGYVMEKNICINKGILLRGYQNP